VRNDDRQGVRVLGADVNEMDVQPIDVGEELRQGIQLRLDLAPVVPALPVAHQALHRRQLDTLRSIGNGFLFRPVRSGQAPAQVRNCLVRDMHLERANSTLAAARREGRRLHIVVHRLAGLGAKRARENQHGHGQCAHEAPALLNYRFCQCHGLDGFL